jgi:hypothetical protein
MKSEKEIREKLDELKKKRKEIVAPSWDGIIYGTKEYFKNVDKTQVMFSLLKQLTSEISLLEWILSEKGEYLVSWKTEDQEI